MEISLDEKFKKKVEKIAQAIYLASYHIKDSEPLKWELRKESIAFLACSRSIGQNSEPQDVPVSLVVEGFFSCASDLISYLRLSFVAGLISKNNASLIIDEIDSCVKYLELDENDHITKAGFVLSEEFFKQLDKGQNEGNQKTLASKDNIKRMGRGENIKDKKESRKGRIIALLKDQSGLTIKDFVRVISDCSEKTIQRELIELVEKGVVKREGERRWSKYSLL